jgi:DNA invertase Pin-like site-specific DNA recombinase
MTRRDRPFELSKEGREDQIVEAEHHAAIKVTMTKLKAAIYARYSTDRQSETSIEDQVRRCRDYAERLGYEVVRVYSDAAISGTHADRPGLQQLLADATASRRPPFVAVIVETQSRLSRDLLGKTEIIYRDLARVGVRVLDTSGFDSTSETGEMQSAMFGIIDATYVKQVAKMTHRGMEGRALAGFWTGGRVYGYATINEPNPPNPEQPRKIPVIDLTEAEVVRRVFSMFVIEKRGMKSIADQLNRDGIGAPHDHGKGHKGVRGWGHTTIRAMLANERYLGRWAWNTHKWTRVAGERKRRRIARPRSEHIVKLVPELAIIDRDLFDGARARLRTQTEGRGRPPGSSANVYLTSGLLRCGVCGSKMSVISQKTKNGVRYARFGCSAHDSRGDAICDNALGISEMTITKALVESLRELFADPAVVRRLTLSIASKVAKLSKPTSSKPSDASIAEIEARIRNVTALLANRPDSPGLLAQLDDEERRLSELKAARRSTGPGQSLRAPSETQVAGYLQDLVGTLAADPVAGRAVLQDILSPVTLTPKTEPRGYQCRAEFRLPGGLGAVGSSAPRIEKYGSGGRI